MRIVLDTNVIVAALLNPGRTPDLAIDALVAAGGVVLVDDRIRAEYADVLARKKFSRIDPAVRDALMARIESHSENVGAVPVHTAAMIDEDDRVFVEVAMAGRADAIVSGNLKHFPDGVGVAVISPAVLLERIRG